MTRVRSAGAPSRPAENSETARNRSNSPCTSPPQVRPNSPCGPNALGATWMTRILTVSLVTLGDPGRLTGGYRYHRRMAELAPACDAEVRFVSFPDRPFPLPTMAGPTVLRQTSAGTRADVL